MTERVDAVMIGGGHNGLVCAYYLARAGKRVRVLERIVTDRGYDVATQIEALRDQRRVEELIDDREERKPS